MMRYSPYSNVVSETTSASYPAALANRHFWYDPSDLTTITKDGADIVSRVNDKLGNGKDLVTGSALWTADTLLFNGTDQYLRTGTWAWSQPGMIYMIVKQVSWSNSDTIFDGYNLNTAKLMQKTPTPNLSMYAGTAYVCDSNLLPVGTWGIIRVYFSGVNSRLTINDNTPVTGNPGTSNLAGFTLGRPGNYNDVYGNFQVKDVIGMPSTEGEDEIYNWLVTRL